MAGSRLPNLGTIFSRMTGLLETKAVHEEPIWYKVWKKYPPELEPYTDRPMPPQEPILEIVYEEDFDRAKSARANLASTRSLKRGSRNKFGVGDILNENPKSTEQT